MDDNAQARQFIERALARAPDAAILNYHMGMVFYKDGEIDKAYLNLSKALEGEEDFYGRQTAEETFSEIKAMSSLNG